MKIFDFNKLTETVSAYIETRIELLKLDMKDQSVKLLAKFLTWSMVISSVATAMFFISLGLSALFNELLESTFLGYLIVAGIYLLIGLITYLSRKMIERSLMVQVKDSDLLEVTIDEDE